MAFLRVLVAARPLAAHVVIGASSAAGMHLAFYDSAADEDPEAWANGSPWAPSPPRDQDESEFWTDLVAAAVTGGLQGGAMRYWYPGLEGLAQRAFASRGLQTAAKVVMDAAPAALSTLGLNAAAQYYYTRTYGVAADADSLLARMRAIAEDVNDAAQGAVEAATAAARGSSSTSREDDNGGGDAAAEPSSSVVPSSLPLPAGVLPLDELEAIDAVLDTRPTPANAITAAVTLLNFSVVPRQLRGLVGTVQWQAYEALTSLFLDEAEEDLEARFGGDEPPPGAAAQQPGGGGSGSGRRPLSTHTSYHVGPPADGSGGLEVRVRQDVVVAPGGGAGVAGGAAARGGRRRDEARTASGDSGNDDGSSDGGDAGDDGRPIADGDDRDDGSDRDDDAPVAPPPRASGKRAGSDRPLPPLR
jgi:hypothetical protein